MSLGQSSRRCLVTEPSERRRMRHAGDRRSERSPSNAVSSSASHRVWSLYHRAGEGTEASRVALVRAPQRALLGWGDRVDTVVSLGARARRARDGDARGMWTRAATERRARGHPSTLARAP